MELDCVPKALYFRPKEERQVVYDAFIAKGQFFGIQYSNSSRATCRGCGKTIQKGELRMKHIVCSTRCFNPKAKKPAGYQDVCGCWHAKCFCDGQSAHPEWFSWTHNKCEWKPSLAVDRFAGFAKLKSEDQEYLRKCLGSSAGITEAPISAVTKPKPPKRRQVSKQRNLRPRREKSSKKLHLREHQSA